MKIEIWSDFVCPFCYIGKKKLEKALNAFEHKDKVQVIFKSYQLNPNAPDIVEDEGYEAFGKVKHVSALKAKEMMEPVVQIAKTYGLDYRMDRIKMTSTFKAHRLAKWARTLKKEKALTEAFFHAYFTNGANLADENTLLELVESVGLDKQIALSVLESNLYEEVVTGEINEAKNLGISGVPFFVFDRKFAISGAQPDEHFLQALHKAYETASPFETIGSDDESLCGPEGECAI